MSGLVASEKDLNMLDEEPVICILILYHSLRGGALVEALKSIELLDYPKSRLMLTLIDNYSRDGAFEYVRNWINRRKWEYMQVVHIRAHGSYIRLRNIGLLTALRAGVKYLLSFDSDMIADAMLLKRLLDVMTNYSQKMAVFSVSAMRSEGFENLDWLEKRRTKWLKIRKDVLRSVTLGEACNAAACLIDLEKVKEIGFLDEDIVGVDDLDWGRRATRKGFVCLFDGRVVIRHLKKYSLREFRKYFFKGALSEAKLFLKNGLTVRVLRSALYWDAILVSTLLAWFTPIPLALLVAVGYAAYFRRCVGLGRLLLYPVTAPFSVARSLALTAAMTYWVLKGGYTVEKVTVLGEPDWEVVDRWVGSAAS